MELTSDYKLRRKLKNIKNLKKIGEILELLLYDPSEFKATGDFRKRVFSILPENEIREMIDFLESDFIRF